MDNQRNTLFPASVVLQAQHSQRTYSVATCVTLAQWALESDYGAALSGKNNPFGIKGEPGTLCWTWEVENGKPIHVQAYFKDFDALEQAFDYHGHMLTRLDGYYAKALPYLSDWQAFIDHMAPIYATDPQYAAKLASLIQRWELEGYDLAGT